MSNADRPGEYRLAIRLRHREINPGDHLKIEIYITGYGKIGGSKIGFYPPLYFIAPGVSKAFSQEGGEVSVGRGFEEGFQLLMSGPQRKGSEDAPPYFDVDPDDAVEKNRLGIAAISTERKRENRAPVEMTLKVLKEAPRGSQNLQFFFTYFNGNEWKSDSQSVDVLVRNWVRRNETLTVIVGVLVALLAFLATISSLIFDVLSYIQ